MNQRITLPLQDVGLTDLALVGGKSASLGEMIRNLSVLGIHIPGGFVITTDAYWQFLQQSNLEEFIREELTHIDFNNVESLRRSGSKIRQAISNARFPHELSHQIIAAYEALSRGYDQAATDVAVRSPLCQNQ
jgi:pyruvate,water dikinase